ncbi:MAG: type II toxin-antitoxin system VapC family toxin [Longimicrobiales bacterium]|nr:type II toxin-antitoxin system VapC family toxin [Longimicrobiales bacterium]
MRILPDTHVWLWMTAEPERLGPDARALLEDASNEILLSAASAWEIAIKVGIGKLRLPERPSSYIPSRMQAGGVAPLPITLAHAAAVAGRPPHHRDPFDRLLVAQARIEGVPLLTSDPQLDAYDVERIAAS